MTDFDSQLDNGAANQGQPPTLDSIVGPFQRSYDKAYQLVGVWILPSGVGPSEFIFILLTVALGAVWVVGEVSIRFPTDRIQSITVQQRTTDKIIAVSSSLALISGVGTLLLVPISAGQTTNHVGLGVVLLNTGFFFGLTLTNRSLSIKKEIRNALAFSKVALTAGSTILVVSLIYIQIIQSNSVTAINIGIILLIVFSAVSLWVQVEPASNAER
jgi:hypothetical protein